MSNPSELDAGCDEAQGAIQSGALGGLRYDAGKTRFDLIPFDALLSVAKVYTQGAEKYAPRNWEKGMLYSRCLGSLMRHLVAWETGEDNDAESKLPHMAHVAWNALALLTYHLRGTGSDDRPSRPEPESRRETIERLLKEEFDLPAIGLQGIDRDSLKFWKNNFDNLEKAHQEQLDKNYQGVQHGIGSIVHRDIDVNIPRSTVYHRGTGAEAVRIEEKIALNNARAASTSEEDIKHCCPTLNPVVPEADRGMVNPYKKERPVSARDAE